MALYYTDYFPETAGLKCPQQSVFYLTNGIKRGIILYTMRKVSARIVWYAFISVSIILILDACAKPIDVQPFLEDDTVQGTIVSTKGLVKIDTRSDGYKDLKAGNGKISSLKKDKYYMIETERDENGVSVTGGPWYVTDYNGPYGSLGPGGLINYLGVITRISGGSINGLKNDHIYKVREAAPFPDDEEFNYKDSVTGDGTVVVTEGTITIPASTGNISLVDLDEAYDGWEVMAIAVGSPTFAWGYNEKTIGAAAPGVTSFPLEGEGTTVDYIFVKIDGSVEFRVLKVIIKTIEEGDTVINLAAIPGVTPPVAGATPVADIETSQYIGTVRWSPTVSGTFAAATQYTARILLTAKPGFILQGVKANFFTVSGATSVSNLANSGIITAVFPVTGNAIIDIAAIEGVTVPISGETPVTAITETTQYTGTVEWLPNDTTFAALTVYTATITLMPKPGFILTGVKANFFTVSGATTVSNSADSGVITAVFPATDTATSGATLTITFTISDLSISGAGNPASVTYSELANGTKSLVFTLNGGYTGVTWKLGNVTAVGSSDTGLTINKNSNLLLPLLVPGKHRLDVKGTKDGQNYGAYIEFDVN
jgi:hypothetical protein